METWTWAPVGGDFRAGLASRDACIAAAKKEGIGEIFLQRMVKADPSPAILDGYEYILAMIDKASRTMPGAHDHLWLQNVPPESVMALTNLLQALTSWWMKDHKQNPDWCVAADMQLVDVE